MPESEEMRVLTRTGVRDIEVTDPAERSMLGQYWNAVQKFLGTGEEETLEPFKRQTIAVKLETDPDWIEYYAKQGELDIDDIYSAGGSR